MQNANQIKCLKLKPIVLFFFFCFGFQTTDLNIKSNKFFHTLHLKKLKRQREREYTIKLFLSRKFHCNSNACNRDSFARQFLPFCNFQNTVYTAMLIIFIFYASRVKKKHVFNQRLKPTWITIETALII
jgi:hypothetical protein